MSNAVSLLGLETLELALNVDTNRLPADSFKLSAGLLAVVTTRRTGLAAALAAASLAEGDRAGASTICRNALIPIRFQDSISRIQGHAVSELTEVVVAANSARPLASWSCTAGMLS